MVDAERCAADERDRDYTDHVTDPPRQLLEWSLAVSLLAPDLVVGRRLGPRLDPQDGRGEQRIIASPDRPRAMLRDEDLLRLQRRVPCLGQEVPTVPLLEEAEERCDLQQALSDDAS